MKDLLTALQQAARFTPTASFQRFGYACGALLVLSGVFHGIVYLVDGGPWTGAVSWRKPIVFGLSFGITLLTLTWFMSFLRPRRITGWIVLGTLAVASLGEVFLISMQKWRGVASHFNEDTTFDESVFSMMGLLVTVVAIVTVFVAVRSFFSVDAPTSMAWAIRTGLVLMLISQAVGVQMIIEGGNTFGANGALKLPHAFTLHAVQVLPALAVVLSLSDVEERRRVKVVALGAVGYAGLIAATMVQTYAGRSPLDVGTLAASLAVAGVVLLLTTVVIALRGVASWLRAPTRSAATDQSSSALQRPSP